MSLSSFLLLPQPFRQIFTSKNSNPSIISPHSQIQSFCFQNPTKNNLIFSNILSVAVAATVLYSPLQSLAIPSMNSQANLLPPSTPFSQSKNLQIGLEDGKIRPCPSANPSCISTNPKSASFAFPLVISENSSDNAPQKLQEAIMKTQKNAKIEVIEDTPYGKYIQAEVDGGGFGRDVIEFLVKRDVVAYRTMTTKVTYIYPFATALGDSKGQQERMKKIVDELGWYAPNFDSMD